MASTISDTDQLAFCRRWLMTRRAIDPRHYGVDMHAAEFMDLLVDEFNGTFLGSQSFDELLLRPREPCGSATN
jgi:hypothetical protein